MMRWPKCSLGEKASPTHQCNLLGGTVLRADASHPNGLGIDDKSGGSERNAIGDASIVPVQPLRPLLTDQ